MMAVERESCQCEACVLAGANKFPQRRDGRTGEWLHGRELYRWWQAKWQFEADMRRVFAGKGMR